MKSFRYEALTVNKYGFATVDTNSYGLPPELAGEIVQAKILFDRIEFFYDHRKLTEYKRSYGRNEEHYITQTSSSASGALPSGDSPPHSVHHASEKIIPSS